MSVPSGWRSSVRPFVLPAWLLTDRWPLACPSVGLSVCEQGPTGHLPTEDCRPYLRRPEHCLSVRPPALLAACLPKTVTCVCANLNLTGLSACPSDCEKHICICWPAVCPSARLCVCRCVCLPICKNVTLASVCGSDPACLSVCLPVCLPAGYQRSCYLSANDRLCLSVGPSVYKCRLSASVWRICGLPSV